MITNIKQKDEAVAIFPPRPMFRRYLYSDRDSECNSILEWFVTHLILTTEDAVYALKVARLEERIATLRRRGYQICSLNTYVKTVNGRKKKTTIFFLRAASKHRTAIASQRYLIERAPSFEDIDTDHMDQHERTILLIVLHMSQHLDLIRSANGNNHLSVQ